MMRKNTIIAATAIFLLAVFAYGEKPILHIGYGQKNQQLEYAVSLSDLAVFFNQKLDCPARLSRHCF